MAYTRLHRIKKLQREFNENLFNGKLGIIDIIYKKMGDVAGAYYKLGFMELNNRIVKWDDVAEILLHEMVHQWQFEVVDKRTIGVRDDDDMHDEVFTKKYREVCAKAGIKPDVYWVDGNEQRYIELKPWYRHRKNRRR